MINHLDNLLQQLFVTRRIAEIAGLADEEDRLGRVRFRPPG